MVVRIITLHSIYNPGSVLQALGLQEFLNENGYDADIIDYRPFYSTIGKNKLKGIIRKIIYHKNEQKVKNKYEAFINDKMSLTNRTFRTFEDLENNVPQADVYISGSDQLWNMDYDCGCDDAYYLKFIKKGNKISYATSIGKKIIPQKEIKLIAEKISDFKMISVREKSNCKVLSDELQRKIYWVCDPVFLLEQEYYEKMTRRIIKGKYAVVYLSEESDLLNKIVNDIKEKKGYKVILMGGNITRCACDLHIKDLGPIDFISLIKYAEIVISSSFHATAFSHIFHKKFGIILPAGNGERLESLVNLSGLSNRIIHTDREIKYIYPEIDYDLVDEKLNFFIDESKKLLIETLEGIKNN